MSSSKKRSINNSNRNRNRNKNFSITIPSQPKRVKIQSSPSFLEKTFRQLLLSKLDTVKINYRDIELDYRLGKPLLQNRYLLEFKNKENKTCFELEYDYDYITEKFSSASLNDYFYSNSINMSNCIEPDIYKLLTSTEWNDYFMSLFDCINIELGITRFTLQDSSSLYLANCRFPLGLLKILQTGYGFYNRYGFYFLDTDIEQTNTILKQIHDMSNLEIDKFFNMINNNDNDNDNDNYNNDNNDNIDINNMNDNKYIESFLLKYSIDKKDKVSFLIKIILKLCNNYIKYSKSKKNLNRTMNNRTMNNRTMNNRTMNNTNHNKNNHLRHNTLIKSTENNKLPQHNFSYLRETTKSNINRVIKIIEDIIKQKFSSLVSQNKKGKGKGKGKSNKTNKTTKSKKNNILNFIKTYNHESIDSNDLFDSFSNTVSSFNDNYNKSETIPEIIIIEPYIKPNLVISENEDQNFIPVITIK
jgi:hypothetical protein